MVASGSIEFFGNRESGHSYKVALMLAVSGLPHVYHAVDLSIPREKRPEAFRAASRFGEVPAVVIDGEALVQSNAILLRLAEISGKFGGDARQVVREWLFWETNRIGFSLPNLRLLLHFTPDPNPEIVGWLQKRVFADLDRLEREFADGKPFLTGNEPSISDFSCCSYLFWPKQAGIDLAGWPKVGDWLHRIRVIPGWREPYELM